jgi:hypothetical protein|nr:MAG TPA: hypothetical protein [Caudoviricetes sp.]
MNKKYLVDKEIDGIRVKVYFNEKKYTEEEKRQKIAQLVYELADLELGQQTA